MTEVILISPLVEVVEETITASHLEVETIVLAETRAVIEEDMTTTVDLKDLVEMTEDTNLHHIGNLGIGRGTEVTVVTDKTIEGIIPLVTSPDILPQIEDTIQVLKAHNIQS